ncbi:hypothetical protein M1Q06_04215 [Planococcus sp. 11815]|uniref:hypothetical protein n=1 Tax=Planococcus sp. 11815 TaxID=2939413 RepID=UPI003DA1E746
MDNIHDIYKGFDFHSLKGRTIDFSTFGNIVSTDEIDDFKEVLDRNEIAFNVHDKEGKFLALDAEFFTTVTLVLHSQVVNSLVLGVSSSAVWEAIKHFSKKTQKNTCDEKYTSYTANGASEKDITFSINAKVNNNEYVFHLSKVPLQQADTALDKILEFLSEQDKSDSFSQTHIVKYSDSNSEWISKELGELIDEKKQLEEEKK